MRMFRCRCPTIHPAPFPRPTALKSVADNIHQVARSVERRSALRRDLGRGFTLIELMMVAAIIAILVAVALPSYRDYVLRGRLVDATNLLSAGRASMERYFQDNRTYAVVGSINPPCSASIAVAQRTQGYFVLTCTSPAVPDASTYTLTATGSGPVAAFSYTVDQLGQMATVIASGGPAGWSGSSTCWIMKRGGAC